MDVVVAVVMVNTAFDMDSFHYILIILIVSFLGILDNQGNYLIDQVDILVNIEGCSLIGVFVCNQFIDFEVNFEN